MVNEPSMFEPLRLYCTLFKSMCYWPLSHQIHWRYRSRQSPSIYIITGFRDLWSCQKVCDVLVYLLDNIFIIFGTKLYRQTIGIPMGTNCAPLVADLFLFCYERDFMKSLLHENQADIIEAFNSTSRYLDHLLNIDNIYFDQMVDRIYPTELQLNRANSSDTEAPFLDLNLCISDGTVSTKIYDKRRFWFWYSQFYFYGWRCPPAYLIWGIYISTY